MSIISYTQNLEDVLLWRALHQHGPGFYIDIGTEEPTSDSVTQLFYENNWRGINLTATSTSLDRFKQERPRDINLTAEEIKDTPTLACTFAKICEIYINQDVHFLHLNTAKNKTTILTDINSVKYRPWVIVIKTAAPNTYAAESQNWEHLLLQAQYIFAHSDGLNRFYIAAEKHGILASAFATPPNHFDNYQRHTEHALRQQNAAYIAKIKALEAELDICYQESYESSRYIGWLSVNQANLQQQLTIPLFEIIVRKTKTLIKIVIRKFFHVLKKMVGNG